MNDKLGNSWFNLICKCKCGEVFLYFLYSRHVLILQLFPMQWIIKYLKYTFSYIQLCLRRLGVKMSREIVMIVLVISAAIFVQYQIVPKYGQKMLKYGQMKPERLLVAWKNFYTELKTWSERMANVDVEQLKTETEGCYLMETGFCFYNIVCTQLS